MADITRKQDESDRKVQYEEKLRRKDAQHEATVRERDMAMRNSELSFRIRTLEDMISRHKEEKQSLEKKLTAIQKEMSPLKDQNEKLKIRCNELNATLRSREKKINQLSQGLLEMKSSHQQLQEEFGKSRRNLSQQMNQCSEYRTQKQKLVLKNEKLRDAYEKLSARVKELEDYRDNSLTFSLPTSPIQGDDHLSVTSSSSQLQEQIDQLEFDKDEVEAKYEEMKNEFKALRDKYKVLRSHYQGCLVKHDDSIRQVQRKFGIDLMNLEREVVLLRCARDENLIDQARHKFILLSQEEKIRKHIFRIESLEKFIIERDEVIAKKELRWKEECRGYVNEMAEESCDNGDSSSAKLFIDTESQTTAISYKSISEVEIWSTTAGCSKTSDEEPVCGFEKTNVKRLSEDIISITGLQQQLTEKQENTFSTENQDDIIYQLESKLDLQQQQLSAAQTHNHNLLLELEKKMIDENFQSQKQDEIIYLKQQLSEEQANSHSLQLLLEECNLQSKNQRELNEPQLLLEEQTRNCNLQLELEKKHEKLLLQKQDEVMHLKEQLSEEQANSHSLQFLLEESNLQSKNQRELNEPQLLLEEQTRIRNLQLELELEKKHEKLLLQKQAEVMHLKEQLSEEQANSHNLHLLLEKSDVQSKKQLLNLQMELEKKRVAHDDLLSQKQDEITCLKQQLSKELTNSHDLQLLLDACNLQLKDVTSELEEKGQLSEEQSHNQLLLENLKRKLIDQEDAHRLQSERQKDVITKLNAKVEEIDSDKETAVNLAQKLRCSLLQAEEACSKVDLCKQLHNLREHMERFIQLVLRDDLVLPKKNALARRNIEQGQPHIVEKDAIDFEQAHLALRLFLVVMDYDPQSLCITGQPELELSVQSGSIVTVMGEMENGYYTASYNNSVGIVPANFVQEIEICDEELIARLIKQHHTWNPKSMESEHGAFILVSKEREHIIDISEMSTSLEAKATSECNKKVSGTLDEQHKTFLGLYDYDPLTSSASANPEFELSFKEGSLIKIFGQEMSDGYYIGELNGQRGLVPANFIVDISTTWSPSLLGKSKTMIALYDYKPLSDSPNTYSDTELAFRAGEHIIIYGNMHSDGFYTGQLGEKFGLVPSNYVKEQSH